jgi:hypothetical protein
VWGIRTNKNKKRTTYTLRWSVAGKDFPQTFAVKALAESRRADFIAAQRRGEAFDDGTGLPDSEMRHRLTSVTFYANAIEFMDMKWPALGPGSRRTLAEALATVTLALVDDPDGRPGYKVAFRALTGWSFNKTARGVGQPGEESAEAIAWVETHSLPLSSLADPKVARVAYNSTTTSHEGKPFAADTYRNKMQGLTGAIKYGIELGRLTTNPLEKICTTPPRKVSTVDRRVVVNPAQARALIRWSPRAGEERAAAGGVLRGSLLRRPPPKRGACRSHARLHAVREEEHLGLALPRWFDALRCADLDRRW